MNYYLKRCIRWGILTVTAAIVVSVAVLFGVFSVIPAESSPLALAALAAVVSFVSVLIISSIVGMRRSVQWYRDDPDTLGRLRREILASMSPELAKIAASVLT